MEALAAADPDRGHHPGHRVGPRPRRGDPLGRELAAGADATVSLVNLSGRGDKDVDTAVKWFGLTPARPHSRPDVLA